MGEAPEACLPTLILLCSTHHLRKLLPVTVCAALLAGDSSCVWLTLCVWFAALQALDMCVRLMLRGEVAGLTSSWRFAYEGREDAPEVCSSDVMILYTCGTVVFVVFAVPHGRLPQRLPAPGFACIQGLVAGDVEFEIELLGFEKEAHQQMLSGADKLERGARLKDQGNQLFKQVRPQLQWLIALGACRHVSAHGGLVPCLLH